MISLIRLSLVVNASKSSKTKPGSKRNKTTYTIRSQAENFLLRGRDSNPRPQGSFGCLPFLAVSDYPILLRQGFGGYVIPGFLNG